MPSQFFKSVFEIPGAGALPNAQVLCASDLPLVLFPVRLETRFFLQADGATELRVRVYPDKIHLDSHERDLTRDEQTWGQHFWRQDWLAGDDATRRADAWRQLADRFGAARAAWIVRLLLPANTEQRPTAATAPDGSLAIEPLFPSLPHVDDTASWRSAACARLLPDRWTAIIHASGQVALTATGREITQPLVVGPDPHADPPDAETDAAISRGEQLAIEPGMLWMTDFDIAESAGMAIRMTIPAQVLAAGIDSLVVLGVSSTLDAHEQLADLLDAHHYTDGLAFVRPGTPTNNSEDRRADYSSSDPGHARSFAIEFANTDALEGSNAANLGNALGLAAARIPATLGRIERGVWSDERDMHSMNTALWQVGWGYFLSNMIGVDAGLSQVELDWARGHFITHVRSFGPLPALRAGRQPYGLLTVTSLDRWRPDPDQPESPQDSWLQGFLLSLRDQVWRQALGSVARLGRRAPPDPDADLADVMVTDGLSGRYRARNAFGQHFLQSLLRFVGSGLPSSHPGQTALLEQLGLRWRPRQSRLWQAALQQPLTAPLVRAGEVSPWTKLEPNYIADLLAERSISRLIAMRPEDGSTNLLQTLLRHGLLREIAHASALLQVEETGAELLGLLRDAELIDLVPGAAPTPHWKRQLELVLPVTAGRTIREFIESQTDFARPSLMALGEFRASLDHLQRLDSESLSQHMQGSLDLSAHRLDAWITSFASKRLSEMRRRAPSGLHIGGYGWVENLAPLAAGLPPSAGTAPLQAAVNDTGFIHAPSLTHAAAAALLRNAQLGPTAQPGSEGPFAIDLSSRRVREATRLLEGMRRGQPLGALLGYRVERLLHETSLDAGRTLDRFIAPLRRIAPLVARARPGDPAPGAVETIAANNVVDGLVLQRRWGDSTERQQVIDELAKVGMTSSEQTAISAILDQLSDAIDGLSDALTAETAYQLARGNTARVASTLAAIAQGDAPPPELEVARMPRTGTALTHRVALLMSGVTNLNTPGWFAGDAGVRSSVERLLNFWAAQLLGDPRRVRCTVESLGANLEVLETLRFPLSDFRLTPLDVVYGVDTAEPDAAPTVVEQWIIYRLQHEPGGFGPASRLRVQHAQVSDRSAGEITLFDLLEQARVIRRLLGVARGAGPEDLNPPERAHQATIDVAELERRVVRAENLLNAAHKGLSALLDRLTTTTTCEALRTALLQYVAFGIGPAIPVSVAGEDAAAKSQLASQAKALLKVSGPRLDQGARMRAQPVAADPRTRCEQLSARMRLVFGPDFVVLPRFSLDPASATELTSALRQTDDPLTVHTWLTRAARVREALGHMGECLQRAEVNEASPRLDLKVAQLPFVEAERWVGLPLAGSTALAPNKLSFVVHSVGAIDPTKEMTGVLFDEWVEVVPNTHETSALAFQFDGPDACAPQAILIAVPPVPGEDWTVEGLRRVLVETLDLAKLRGVHTSALDMLGQHLPGLYLAFNAADHVVSTDFAPLTRPRSGPLPGEQEL